MSKSASDNEQMASVLAACRLPENTGWEHGWVGLEPTFQSKKSIKKWGEMSRTKEGEDAYFVDKYMLRTELEVARAIADRYTERRKKGKKCAPFARVKLEPELDQWKVCRQNLHFYWDADGLGNFEAKWALDPETFEWSIKPFPIAWLYEEPFVRFLEEFVFGVPMAHGLTPSIAYVRRARRGDEPTAPSPPLDAQEFLARVIMHIPEPRLHVIRYYGAYSSVVRARRRQRARAAVIVASTQAGLAASAEPSAGPDPRILRRRWAELIRRIYEADPLVCPRCGGEMRIVAFITEPRVIHKILAHLAAKGADGRAPPDSTHDQRPAA